jgi:hypothetical protein
VDREAARAEATLEVELSGEAPAGELRSADGVKRSFSGWTELASAIEQWRSTANDAQATRDGSANR